jgi:hypothetical protein
MHQRRAPILIVRDKNRKWLSNKIWIQIGQEHLHIVYKDRQKTNWSQSEECLPGEKVVAWLLHSAEDNYYTIVPKQ